MTESESTSPPPKRHLARWGLLIVLFALAPGIANYASQTDWVPQLVDAARNLPFIGPDRVATMENVFYTVQDAWNKVIYDNTHGPIVVAEGSQAGLDQSKVAKPDGPSSALPSQDKSAIVTATSAPGTLSSDSTVYSPPKPILPIILSDPQPGEGIWTTANMPLGDTARPPMWHTFFRPDPERPYAHADLVWVDLSRTELTLVQGTVEPRPIDGIKGTGQIPLDIQKSGKLIAAWNGGFLTLHGAYGMMIDRRIIAPPRDGYGVLAQYTDGSVRVGVWGKDISMTPDLVSFRQNGPILIDHGEVNQDASLTWGRSVSGGTRIWRSGIGLTARGELIFGIGDSLDAQTLGEAMRQAGADEAIELDVNAWHAFFFTYQQTPAGTVGSKLDASIPGPSQLYLKPYGRDFMYLTLK